MMNGIGIMKRMLYEKPRARLRLWSEVASLQPGQAEAVDAVAATSIQTNITVRQAFRIMGAL
jgi:hypothetical protein